MSASTTKPMVPIDCEPPPWDECLDLMCATHEPHEVHDDVFDEYSIPTQLQLRRAANLWVIAESGVRVSFGSLWQDQKTIVIFIRHFMCPLCQDYMFSISRNISPQVLDEADVNLVIISNGDYQLIKSYRKIFHTPFALYTDPSHEVYKTMGMTIQTLEKGPRSPYIRHGLLGGIGMVVANAAKVGMPVWKEKGDIKQLGGEFILGPGFECSFAHRMRYTRSHLPILDVVSAAGVDMLTPLTALVRDQGETYLGVPLVEEFSWMKRRKLDLTKLTLKGRTSAFWITALPGLGRLTSATEEVDSETSDETLRDESGTPVLLEARPLSIIWEEAEDEG
ncbi:hypothetical protein VNI00_004078 [Paramarasmius palmivorus]|uniref:Thioredoxin-like protein AAED1 n=1 Tax=Paramarasmius palmivorus TaxID=297713 RepID=A0AAW0DQT5_9AGAR